MSQFYGNHAISMDVKGRIAVPTRVRELLQDCCGGRIVLTAHTESRCLHVFPEDQWNEVLAKLEGAPTFNERFRRIKLTLVGYATMLELDGNGRILIPGPLRDYGHLTKKLMLVGQGKSLELWDEDDFTAYITAPVDSGDELPEGMQSLALY